MDSQPAVFGVESSLACFVSPLHVHAMSVAQLQEELSKLTAQEKLALADRLVREAARETRSAGETALLSEAALAKDWNRAEEDAAWQHLQRAR